MARECSHCGRPVAGRYWISPFGPGRQCARLWCRVRSGHWFWMTFGRRLTWAPWRTVTVRLPRLRKS